MLTNRIVILIVLAMAVSACKPDWEEVKKAGNEALEARRAAAQKRMSDLDAVTKTAAAQKLESLPAFDWAERPKPRFGIGRDDTNAELIALPVGQGDKKEEIFSAYWWDKPASLLAGDMVHEVVSAGMSLDETRSRVNRVFDKLERIRYLLVFKAQAEAKPDMVKLNSEGFKPGSDKPMGTFSSGKISGQVLLYDVKDAKFLGAAAVSAKNSDKIEVRGSPTFLRDNLVGNLRIEIRKLVLEAGAEW